MPCDTPPPPPFMDDITENDEEPDDSMIEVIDMDELDEVTMDNSIATFSAHNDAVFCCNFDKTGQYVVTGGQDEKAFVWSVQDKSIKFECSGHSDSVIAVNFSPDSNYVSTADMNGLIQVWSMESGAVIWDFDTFEITWTDWLHGANVLLAGSIDGTCWKWDIPDGTSTVFEHTNTGFSIGCISHDDMNLVTGYYDGTLKFWDIPNNKLTKTLTDTNGHKGSVTCIKYSVDDSLIFTTSVDGTVKVIKASDCKVLWTINGCDSNHESISVESVGFDRTLSYIVIGTNCGCLSIWDLQTKTRRHNIELGFAAVKIICDEVDSTFYAAIGNGFLSAYDIRSGNHINSWVGHYASLFDFAISSDRRLLLTASEDQNCKIFERAGFNVVI